MITLTQGPQRSHDQAHCEPMLGHMIYFASFWCVVRSHDLPLCDSGLGNMSYILVTKLTCFNISFITMSCFIQVFGQKSFLFYLTFHWSPSLIPHKPPGADSILLSYFRTCRHDLYYIFIPLVLVLRSILNTHVQCWSVHTAPLWYM